MRKRIGRLAIVMTFGILLSGSAVVSAADRAGGLDKKEKAIGDFNEVTPELRQAVESSLDWLSARVMASPNGAIGHPYPTALTALAGIAFLAHGDTPTRGKYAEPLNRALKYVMSMARQKPAVGAVPKDYVAGLIDTDGSLKEKRSIMYSHGYATLFLAEAYGTTRDPEVRRVLREAVGLIERSQGPGGGWDYGPVAQQKRYDMSVGVCQTMALRAARNTGILVSRQVVDKAIQCAIQAREKEIVEKTPDFKNGFTYLSAGPSGSALSFHVTCGALCILYGLGVYEDNGKDTPEKNPGMLIQPALRYVLQEVKAAHKDGRIAGRSREAPGAYNFYGVYYTAQALAQAGGEEYWGKGFPMIRDVLIKLLAARKEHLKKLAERQMPSPGAIPWEVNREFETAITCIVLQVPYQYLPIFER